MPSLYLHLWKRALLKSFYNKIFKLFSQLFFKSLKIMSENIKTVFEAPSLTDASKDWRFCKSLAAFKKLVIDASRATISVASGAYFIPCKIEN
jgi:hypothetical protein